MSASVASRASGARLSGLFAAFRPRPRFRELGLLVLVTATLVVGSATAGASLAARPILDAGQVPGGVDLRLLDARALAAYVAGLLAVHLLFVATGRRTDQVLLPAVGMLGGLGLLLMQRLPQGLVTQSFGDADFTLGQVQLGWLLLALAIVGVVGTVVRSDAWLRLYKYTWAATGIALLLLVFLFGREVNGVRLVLAIGPVAGQP